jgi:hypothetical protein
MNEKNFTINIIRNKKILIRKNNYNRYQIQSSNREWISLIEIISIDDFKFPAYVIFTDQSI